LRAGNGDDFKKILMDKAAGDGFILFWEAVARPERKAFPYFQE